MWTNIYILRLSENSFKLIWRRINGVEMTNVIGRVYIQLHYKISGTNFETSIYIIKAKTIF